MKLVRQQPRNAFNSWHRYRVTGRYYLADFETADGVVKRAPRGFRMECYARCTEGGAALERVLSVVAPWVTDVLVPTYRSEISVYHVGSALGPEGDVLVSGIHATRFTLHPEYPVLSSALYKLEGVAHRLKAVVGFGMK